MGATKTAAIARNAVAMPPVNWVAVCGRCEVAVVVDIIGREFGTRKSRRHACGTDSRWGACRYCSVNSLRISPVP